MDVSLLNGPHCAWGCITRLVVKMYLLSGCVREHVFPCDGGVHYYHALHHQAFYMKPCVKQIGAGSLIWEVFKLCGLLTNRGQLT